METTKDRKPPVLTLHTDDINGEFIQLLAQRWVVTAELVAESELIKIELYEP